MRARLALTLAFLGLLASPTSAPARAEPEAAAPLKAKVDAYFAPLVAAGTFSGAVLLARGGEILVEAAYGKADLDRGVPNEPGTRFKVMSVSKSITALAVMTLVRSERLGLDDPVAKHLALWPESWSAVTVHELMDHTSGIPNLETEWAMAAMEGTERGIAVWRRVAPRFSTRALASAPATRFAYSNFNYILLALVVEAATGRPFREYAKAAVLDPAGMAASSFDDGRRREGLAVGYFLGRGGVPTATPVGHDMSGIEGAGSLISTVGDLHRLDRALEGETILDAATRARMVTPVRASPTYACGWEVSPVHGRPCIHHSGGANGYVADFLRFPEDDACVVVMSNLAFAPPLRVSHDLAALLLGLPLAMPKAVPAAALSALEGVYVPGATSGRRLVVRKSGGGLLFFDIPEISEGAVGEPLIPLGGDAFALRAGEGRARFTGGEGGQPRRLALDPGPVAFERQDVPLDAWRAAAGEYRLDGESAEPTRLTEVDGRFGLWSPDGGPRVDLLPISPTRALALVSDDLATPLDLERDSKGRVVRFRWKRWRGATVEGVRVEPVAGGAVPAPPLPRGPAVTTEVLVLATIHAPWQFRSRSFTPAHVRAALEAAKPDVLGIECPPEWFAAGKFHDVTYEAQGIAVPFAKARGIPVVPIDWQDLPERERKDAATERVQRSRIRDLLAKGEALPLAEYGFLPDAQVAGASEFFRSPDFDFDRVNGVSSGDFAHGVLDGAGDPASPGFGGRRNQEIAARCVSAMAAHPGKRLVVVIGAGHKAVLDALLSRVPNARVLALGRDVPAPSKEAVDRAWTADDLLAVLGHNLDGERSYLRPELVDLPRMGEVLARLAAQPGMDDATAYFRARLLSAGASLAKDSAERDAKAREAERTLDGLPDRASSANPYPFPMGQWRMRYSLPQAVRVERARCLLARGDRGAARRLLDAVARERDAVPGEVEDLLADPGFEATALSTSPLGGWYCADANATGRVRASSDDAVKVEGARSLRLECVKGKGDGIPSVGQTLSLPADPRRAPWEFSLSLRGADITSVNLTAYRLEEGGRRAVEIARSAPAVPGETWTRTSLRVPLPPETVTILLSCYFTGPAGARLWLDGATPLRGKSLPTADLLAREFLRTLPADTR